MSGRWWGGCWTRRPVRWSRVWAWAGLGRRVAVGRDRDMGEGSLVMGRGWVHDRETG